MLSVDKDDHLRYSECFFFHSSGEGCSNQIFWSTIVLEKLICFCKWTSRKPKAWFGSQYSEMPGKLTSISPAAEAITQKYESGVGVGIQEIQNSWERLGADTGLGGGEYDALVENLRRHSHTQALILHLHNPVRPFLKIVPWPLTPLFLVLALAKGHKQTGKQNLRMNPGTSSGHVDASLESPGETWESGRPEPVPGSIVRSLILVATCLEVNFCIFCNKISFPSLNCVSWHFSINYIIVLWYHPCNT